MTQEAYVSFKVAKLLKKKGFDWDCTSHFDSNHIECPNTPMNFNSTKYWVSRPTHQMACAWLREVHKVLIVIDAYHADHWEGYIDSFEISIYSHASTIIVPNEIAHHTDYEEAVEAAIKYCLENLI